jgi:hypothetical protein
MANNMTRRDLVRMAGGASAGFALLQSQALAAMPAQQVAPCSPPSGIERITLKRREVGFRGYDSARAFPGFTLFTPLAGKTVYLVDLQGTIVHTWQMPYPPGNYGYLTERGTLFYNGNIPNDSYVGRSPYHAGAALEMDWSGRILWEVRQPDHHHDGRRLQNGHILLVCATELPADLVSRVRGGLAGSEYEGGKMNGDYLTELTTDGEVVWEWRAWEHLDPAQDAITAVQDPRDEWTHTNSVVEMPDGNLIAELPQHVPGGHGQPADGGHLLEARRTPAIWTTRA